MDDCAAEVEPLEEILMDVALIATRVDPLVIAAAASTMQRWWNWEDNHLPDSTLTARRALLQILRVASGVDSTNTKGR